MDYKKSILKLTKDTKKYDRIVEILLLVLAVVLILFF